MSRRTLVAVSSLAGGLALLTIQGAAQGRSQGQGGGPEFVPNQVIVQFHASITEQARENARGRVKGQREEVLVREDRRNDGKGDLELLRIPPGLAVADAVRGLREDSAVEFAEPNWIYQHQATATDSYYTNGSLWGMYGDATTPTNQYGSQAGEAWAAGKTGSDNVYVGIIDEGVMWSHSDLDGNIWNNPYDPVDGVDNDGNGYRDDRRGWDFVSNNNSTYDGSQDDHGTHVAGTIGAEGNGSGVVGVNWNVTLITAKFLGSFGGTTANAVKSVKYMTDLKTRHGLNIVATNNSWGGGGFAQSLLDAINAGCAANILFVAAAGNSGVNTETSPHYPSSYNASCIISVAALSSNGSMPSWSNFGASSVDLGAPGAAIYSTVPKGSRAGYASYSGTSMATPHVTGGVALYASNPANAGKTATQIKTAILGATVPTASLAGKVVTGGRLNVSGF